MKIPKDTDIDSITYDQVVEWAAATPVKGAAKKTTAKKTTAKTKKK